MKRSDSSMMTEIAAVYMQVVQAGVQTVTHGLQSH